MGKKKLMSLFVLGCSALLLAGCGEDNKKDENKESEKVAKNQTITCVMSEEESGVKSESKITFEFDKKSEKIKSGSMEVSMIYDMSDFTKEEKEQVDKFTGSILGAMCDGELEGFKNCKYEGKDGKYSVSMDVDMEKIEEAYEGEVSEETTIEDLKESFEEQDYTCTIK